MKNRRSDESVDAGNLFGTVVYMLSLARNGEPSSRADHLGNKSSRFHAAIQAHSLQVNWFSNKTVCTRYIWILLRTQFFSAPD